MARSRHKLFKSRAKKRGLPPGTPVFIGTPSGQPMRLHVFSYGPEALREIDATTAAECLAEIKPTVPVTWIDSDGIQDTDLLVALAEGLNMHPLALEDVVNTDQRPKMDDYGQTILLVLKMLRWDEKAEETIVEQVSILLGERFVASFQEIPGDVFQPVRDRIRSARGRERKYGPDYLAYSLLDAIVDGYFAVLEKLGERMEALEDRTVLRAGPDVLRQIHKLKREVLFLRRAVWPVRELVGALERAEPPLMSRAVAPYVRDLYDHAVQVIDTTETLREMVSGLLEAYLASLSNHLNEVMKVLTIIATIFIPLTFIAGVYGMNFRHMPELETRWAYPAVLGLMATVAGGMLYFFRRKRWL